MYLVVNEYFQKRLDYSSSNLESVVLRDSCLECVCSIDIQSITLNFSGTFLQLHNIRMYIIGYCYEA